MISLSDFGKTLRKKFLISLPLKFKSHIIFDVLHKKNSFKKRALIYFKTDPYFSKELRRQYIHTNNEEIVSKIKILDSLGFTVDLVDRDAKLEDILAMPNKNYDLFISNAAGNSAPYHVEFLNHFNFRKKVFYAAGPEPEESNRLVEKQHLNFNQRNSQNFPSLRLVKGKDFDKRFKGIDAIFAVGNKFSLGTYEQKYPIKTFRMYPSTSPRIVPPRSFHKNPAKFVYFGGNGLICKGLDLILEAFDGLHNVELHIGAPDEHEFWQFYAPLLERNSQIHNHGFVEIGGKTFNEITEDAAFTIFPGSAEGSTTSVITCQRRGLIPVVTFETGLDLNDFGIPIQDNSVQAIRSLITSLSKMPATEVAIRSEKSYQAAQAYTLEGFEKSFRDAVVALGL